MEAMIKVEVDKAITYLQENRGNIDSLIYMLFRIENGDIVPLYIEKAGTVSKTQGTLSANIANLDRDKGKFCRWSDNYAYHIGDLSVVVLGHSDNKRTEKYRRLADALFTPRLRRAGGNAQFQRGCPIG